MEIKERVLALKDEIIENLATLVSYPTVYAEDEAGSPFGKANRLCLEKALEIGASYGFKTCNLDNYCGYIEMGEGQQIIGICAHLDVVPVSDSWKTDPFKMTRVGDVFYGRGTSDDKGGAICSLAAMKILNEMGVKANKRIRLILGCNEESGSRGLAYYVEKLGYVDCGFTPDGSFPVIFGEKGMVHGGFISDSSAISDIKAGTVSNAVAANCVITLNTSEFDVEKLAAFFNENNISYTLNDNVLTVKGVAAHASTPEAGVNAISYAIEGLYVAGLKDEFVENYHRLIGLSYYGEGLGLNFEDEYGKLTFNVGVAGKKDGKLFTTIDIRFPVTMKKQQIIEPMVNNGGKYITNVSGGDPLFFPTDTPLIKALLDAYYGVTGLYENKPLTIGGGTYARTMHNIVAFGSGDETDCHIHNDDEFVTLDSLLTQTEIYAYALLNLLEI